MDLKLTWGSGVADLIIENGDLAIERGVTTGVIVSLFSDARAPIDSLPDPKSDPRGWWADPRPEFGSLLWLMEREKQLPETLELAKETVRDALAWLTREGVAESIDVAATWAARGVLVLRIEIARGSARKWAHVWDGMEPLNFESQGVKLDLAWR